MKVRAIKRGYFGGQYRRPGDTFDCPSDQAFSKRWMEKVKKGKKSGAEIPDEGTFAPLEIPSLEFPDMVNKSSPE